MLLEEHPCGWSCTFGPAENRKEIRQWSRKNMKHRHTVDVTCEPGLTTEFWVFDDYDDAKLFAFRWSHL